MMSVARKCRRCTSCRRDGVDRGLDTNGAITRSLSAIQAWMRRETPGRGFAFDTAGGAFDITFHRLSRTDATMQSFGIFIRDEIEADLRAAGKVVPAKI